MATQKPRYTITMEPEMLNKIDVYRTERRLTSRTKATLELISLGLDVIEKRQKEALTADKDK